MAGNKSRLNKILQTIGIVDEPDDGGYDDDYYQQEAQPPRRQQRSASNQQLSQRQRQPSGFEQQGRYRSSAEQPRYAANPQPRRDWAVREAESDPFAEPRRPSRYETPPRPAPRQESRQKTVIYAVRTLEECQDVIMDLIDGKTTLVNLEALRGEYQQRALDTLAGASFALNAVIRKASEKIYLIAPSGVEINDTGAVERRY